MTKKDKLNKLKFYYDYLKLLYLYSDEYEKKFGLKGYQEEVDKALDGINEMRKKIAEDEE